jgi:hypothetical protein
MSSTDVSEALYASELLEPKARVEGDVSIKRRSAPRLPASLVGCDCTTLQEVRTKPALKLASNMFHSAKVDPLTGSPIGMVDRFTQYSFVGGGPMNGRSFHECG